MIQLRAMRCSPAVLFLLSLLSASGFAHANQINAFSFAGTLETPVANQNSVIGQFSLDLTTLVITDYTFTTPIGTVDPIHYNSDPQLMSYSDPIGNRLVVLNFFTASEAGASGLILAFPGTINNIGGHYSTDFSGGPLYTGPIQYIKFFYASLYCSNSSAECSPAGFSSYFTSGSAALVSASAPEPTSLILMIAGMVILAIGTCKHHVTSAVWRVSNLKIARSPCLRKSR